MELTCDKCNRIFNTNYSLGQHKRYCNGIFDLNKLQKDYDGGLSLTELIKKYNLPKYYVHSNIVRRTISESAKLSHLKHPRKFDDKTKEKMRNSRFEYLKKKMGNTPWDKRQRGEMSYLENWFSENVIKKHELFKLYDIVCEYSEYPYFIDFAFLNIKLAVELDGKCHFSNGTERIEHDIKRDEILVKKGWTIYRIRYDQANVESIEKFLSFLRSIRAIEPKIYGDNLYKYQEIKKERCEKKKEEKKKSKIIKRTQEQYFEDKQSKYKDSQMKYIDLLLKSDIDFNKWGWKGQAAKIINQKPQKVHKWMKLMMPDFYKNCR